ncbi:hypothetical protein [Bacillus sp. CGMCC 1.16541]|uniref:hypothetical protein n=1 Tax=Bacillus sp. CGMCC 1.16541 TaxID=2185143 RepID=UPI000D72EE3A|nr:hypothetical protein [Bacillus sp. CGMCC 1.16541]
MSKGTDGGYYALKGFIYQFDTTILEILGNPKKQIYFENQQDINYEAYVIQVKHKETQNFKNSLIKKPVIQLLEEFKSDNTKNFALYCHFKDKSPEEKSLSSSELDKILGINKADYPKRLKELFTNNFKLKFCLDYQMQFEEVISSIKDTYSLQNEDTALIYHMIIHSHLLKSAIKVKEERYINKSDIDTLFQKASQVVFKQAYKFHLTKEKYERVIKRQYFTPKSHSRVARERMFIIDCQDPNLNNLINILYIIAEKYYKAPIAPYVCFRNLSDIQFISLKKQLKEEKGPLFFNDGTFFSDDEFDIDLFTSRNKVTDNITQLKILRDINLHSVIEYVEFRDTYEFFVQQPFNLDIDGNNQIQISNIEQIINMIG